MDRTQNCLAVVGELLEERKDGPSRLTVETGRWLVKEKEKLRFCCQLDRYGETLTLFNIETWAWLARKGRGRVELRLAFPRNAHYSVRI
jgi:hypothetical protein